MLTLRLVASGLFLTMTTMACMRSGGGTTPTPTQNCEERTDAALLAGNPTRVKALYGRVDPVGTCAACAAGSAEYFPDSGTPLPRAVDEKSAGDLICDGGTLCVCEADGTCFTRTNDNVNLILYPYCSGGTCAIYALITAEDDNAGLVSTDGSQTFTSGQQLDANLDYKDVTSGDFPKITYASCDGCPTGPTSCN